MKRAITFVPDEVARILDTRSATIIADIGGAGGSALHALLQAWGFEESINLVSQL